MVKKKQFEMPHPTEWRIVEIVKDFKRQKFK